MHEQGKNFTQQTSHFVSIYLPIKRSNVSLSLRIAQEMGGCDSSLELALSEIFMINTKRPIVGLFNQLAPMIRSVYPVAS